MTAHLGHGPGDPGRAAAWAYRLEVERHRQAIAELATDVPEGTETRRRWWHQFAIEILERAADAEAPSDSRPVSGRAVGRSVVTVYPPRDFPGRPRLGPQPNVLTGRAASVRAGDS